MRVKVPVAPVADRRTWKVLPAEGQVSRTPPAIGVAFSATLGGPRGVAPLNVTLLTCSATLPARSETLTLTSYAPSSARGSGCGAGMASQPPLPAGAKANSIEAIPLCEPALALTMLPLPAKATTGKVTNGPSRFQVAGVVIEAGGENGLSLPTASEAV